MKRKVVKFKKQGLLILVCSVVVTVTLFHNAVLAGSNTLAEQENVSVNQENPSVNQKDVSVKQGKASDKEEVIYVNLNSSGSVSKMYAVNIFDDADIIDYGNYSEVKNLTSTDDILYKYGTINIKNSSKGKFYYEGTLDEEKMPELPWIIDINYFLNGKVISTKNLAGQSGNLKIRMKITKNEKAASKFYDNYALQVSTALDTDICKNIKISGATEANAGSKKQIAGTILPGNDALIEIEAEVTDFEMDAISVNGVRLSMDLGEDMLDMKEFGDPKELTGQMSELTGAIDNINRGAHGLQEGTDVIHNGMEGLQSGLLSVSSGADQVNNGALGLNEGIDNLKAGITSIQDALISLDNSSGSLVSGSGQVKQGLESIQASLQEIQVDTGQLKLLASASNQIKDGIDGLVYGLSELSDGIGSYYDALEEQGVKISDIVEANEDAISSLKDGIKTMKEQYDTLVRYGMGDSETAIQLKTQINSYSGIVQLLSADKEIIEGSDKLTSEIYKVMDPDDGDLMTGAMELQSKYGEFNDGIQSMVEQLMSLFDGMVSLKNGIDSLTAEYGKLDSGLKDYTNAISQILTGYNKVQLGAVSLAEGTKTFTEGTKTLSEGTQSLYQAAGQLSAGSGDLDDATEQFADGTAELYHKTGEIPGEVNNQIDDMMSQLTSYLKVFDNPDFKPISFVSYKNTNVKAVQFVMQTSSIKIPDVEEETKEEDHVTLWDRLINLFR